jgi:peroxiredoxin Q/BCP
MLSLIRTIAGALFRQRSTPARPLRCGDEAPDFTLPGTDGRMHTLSALRGRTVVLAWFPRASTPGCTAECRSLCENGDAIRAFDVAHYMLSIDAPEANRAFAGQLHADFPILSDPAAETAAKYGVLSALGLPRRWTFYVGPDGRIADIDREVSARAAGADIARKLAEMGVKRAVSGQ